MASGQSPRGFESLSSEIVLQIIKQLPELVALDSLVRASPVVFRLFNSYGAEITETVLSSGHIHGHIRAIIRIIALIRTSKLPMDNLLVFQQKTTFAAMRERICSMKKHLSPLQLEKDTPPHILRSLLALYRHLTSLSLKFIAIHLKRYRALKPRRLIDPSKCPKYLDELRKIPRDQTEEYPIKDNGHDPSWEEEQRVIRAFWRVQLLHDMKKAAAEGLLIGWSREDVKAITRMNLIAFYGAHWMVQASDPMGDSTIHPEYNELRSIEAYLCGTLDIYNLAKVERYSSYLTPPHPPQEVQREWSAPEPPASQFLPWRKGMAIWLIHSSPASWAYEYQFPEYRRDHVPFQFFGKFGFAFWDWGRMADFGLLPDVILPGLLDAPFTYRWLSLLEGYVMK